MAHFEIHASDLDAAKAFYTGLFGWSFSKMPGMEGMNYFLISGGEFDNKFTGGLMERMGEAPKAGSPVRGGTVTFEVADVDERYTWALANGGAEALPPTDYEGIGRAAYVEDGQGNIVGMITSAGNGE